MAVEDEMAIEMAVEVDRLTAERDEAQRNFEAAHDLANQWMDLQMKYERRATLLEAVLYDLADLQNGPPLIKDEAEWNSVMERVWTLLDASRAEVPE